ncbi:MAG TPA: 4-hydroxy-tetrahydrodipicolinate reductase [Steroidobacteraceae bacterium]|nr:4-hydroxy-tetrahydrodipicolinate reductase [Steroidobacteraceae bacterium]
MTDTRPVDPSHTTAGPVRVALFGATGRMGRSLIHAIHDSTEFELVGALASADSPALGQDAGDVAGLNRRFGTRVTADRALALERAEVVLDFTLPLATLANAAACLDRGAALVVGTTGLGPEAHAALEAAAQRIAVLKAPNTSLGINLLARLVEQAAAALPAEYDIEILEAHHRYKVDAPSGTALRLGEAAAAGRGSDLRDLAAEHRRHQTGPRREGSIGFAVVRGGDIVGEHTVLYAGLGERLELTHRAHDRMTFAYGALRAANWLRGRAAGQYSMADVLGLR